MHVRRDFTTGRLVITQTPESEQSLEVDGLGRSKETTLEILVTYVFHEGEKAVMYDRDGDGYPGAEAYCEFVSAEVESFCHGDLSLSRADRPELFELLDDVAARTLTENWSGYYENGILFAKGCR